MDSGLLSLKWNNHKSTFHHVLSTIRSKESYCDVTITCDGKFYSLHKFVLSACSDYFQEMFSRTEGKHPIIVLQEINSNDLEALLNYMYVGEVNVEQDKLSGLIKAAECLKIKGLAVPDADPNHSQTNHLKRRHDIPSDICPPKKKKLFQAKEPTINDIPVLLNKEIEKSRNDPASDNQNNSGKKFFPKSEIQQGDEISESNEVIAYENDVKREPADMNETSNSQDFDSDLILQEYESNTASEIVNSEILSGPGSSLGGLQENLVWNNGNSTSISSEHQNQDLVAPIFHNMLSPEKFASISANASYIASSDIEGFWNTQLVCKFCKKVFTDKFGLKTHERIHTGEKPFICLVCHYRSTQLGNLKVHVSKNHSDVPEYVAVLGSLKSLKNSGWSASFQELK